MTEHKPAKKEQMEAILNGSAHELLKNYLSPEELKTLGTKAYDKFFTITKYDILNYLKEKYDLHDLILNKPAIKDGFYVITTENGFKIYEQYRGISSNISFTNNEEDIWDKFVNYLIKTSGTGLKV